MGELRKHIRVITRLWRISLQQNLAFRWQFAASLLDSAVALGLSLLMFEIAYVHTPEIGGWSKYQTILLVGVFHLYATLLQVFLGPNLRRMTDVVFRGELDSLLLKPLSAQVLLSLKSVNVPAALNGVLGISVIAYALAKLGVAPTLPGVMLAAVMLLSGLIVVYALWFISLTLEFWFSGLWSWAAFVPNVFQFARYPEGIYKGSLRVIFLTVAPVIVVANFPTQALLGDLAWQSALYSLGLAGVLLCLSYLQWRFALRRYTSASS